MSRKKPNGGRPTKLDAALTEAILADIAAGVPQEAAAQAAGVSRSTLYEWKKEGVRKPQSEYGRFRTGLERSRAQAHAKLARAYFSQAMNNTGAAQFWFTRREPQTWAEPEQRVRLSGKKGAPIETYDVVGGALYDRLKRMEANAKGEAPK